MNGDSRIDERAYREIYLAPFETAVKEGRPTTVMCSYNKINGTHASDNKELLTNILRDEWGFDGLVVTDWGALNDRIAAFFAGCDLNMPGGADYMNRATLETVRCGELDEEYINASVERILCLVEQSERVERIQVDFDAHHTLARRIAAEGAVLMKNDDDILPLSESDCVIIGSMARNMRYQGSGSSHINPTKISSLCDAMPSAAFCDVGGEDGDVSE